MAHYLLITIIFTITAWSHAEVAIPVNDAAVREPRHLFGKKCQKYGICGNQGGYQGGHQGYQGGYNGYNGGYQGYQGFGPQHPPINIAISQSQSSANQGGYGGPYYGPNNYQYNYPGGPGYGRPGFGGYGGYRPGNFNNGYGSYNSQFNGNYNAGNGGYGFNGPFFDEGSDEKPIHDDIEDGPGGADNFAFAGAYSRSASGRKSD